MARYQRLINGYGCLICIKIVYNLSIKTLTKNYIKNENHVYKVKIIFLLMGFDF